MTSVTIEYDNRNATVRKLIESLLSSGIIRLKKTDKKSYTPPTVTKKDVDAFMEGSRRSMSGMMSKI